MAPTPSEPSKRGSWVAFLLHDLDFALYSLLAAAAVIACMFFVGQAIYRDLAQPWFWLYCGTVLVTVVAAIRDAVNRRLGVGSRIVLGLWAAAFALLLISELTS